MNKIYLLKDKKDYVKKLTNDNIINIIGTKGSGKTTSSLKYIDDDNYIVIVSDRNCKNNEFVLEKNIHKLEKYIKNVFKKIKKCKKV